MSLLAWVWVLPLVGLVLTALGVGRPGTASLAGPLLVGLAGLLAALGGAAAEVRLAGWLPFLPDPSFHLRLDGLSAAMLAVVGLVSFCIYLFSLAYMDVRDPRTGELHAHPRKRLFFCELDFFLASMALLVLGGNLAVLLIGWAGVGLASYLLISFYRGDPHYHGEEPPLQAGLKALAANAVGDAALLLAAVLVPAGCGDLTSLGSVRCTGGPGGADGLAWLILIAACAKSAQGPLYFWLPSAMAGPTPVSALIHAATMVAAGVYLLVRTENLFVAAPGVLLLTAWIGVITAVLSAVASLQQTNFKRGIAYSTLSQLGYMFAGVGFGAPFAAFFHLVTHASFKALLFLTAGTVLHANDGEERLVPLAGMQQRLPVARWLFLIGSLALIGIPVVTSGAFSKDGILEAGLQSQPPLGAILIASVLLTGLYVGRLYWIVFSGPPTDRPVHDPAPLLLWPLYPLALGALLLGYLEFPGHGLSRLLAEAVPHVEPVALISPVGLLAAVLGLVGFFGAKLWRERAGADARLAPLRLGWVGATAALGRGLAGEIAAVNSGRLSRLALTAALGVAVILLLARSLV